MFNNQRGFTLIEMLIVLMIVSVLMLLIIPNLGNKGKEVKDKGCEALVSVVQTQVDSYYLENNEYPSDMDVLVDDKYIRPNQKQCPNSETTLVYDAVDGKVSLPANETN